VEYLDGVSVAVFVILVALVEGRSVPDTVFIAGVEEVAYFKRILPVGIVSKLFQWRDLVRLPKHH